MAFAICEQMWRKSTRGWLPVFVIPKCLQINCSLCGWSLQEDGKDSLSSRHARQTTAVVNISCTALVASSLLCSLKATVEVTRSIVDKKANRSLKPSSSATALEDSIDQNYFMLSKHPFVGSAGKA